MTPRRFTQLSVGSAMTMVILLGLTSLFSDITYQGGRSLAGQYLKLLGASALAVGVAAGAGEFLGYSLRLVSGYVADRTGRYWQIMLLGYGINLLAIPCLALAGRWEIAVMLLFAERIGKAIRNPSRDAMLSHATTQMGRGWGFGLHEALDQIGAFLGPVLLAGVLYLKGGGDGNLGAYRIGFALLFVPALAALTVLLVARFLFPHPADLESKTPAIGASGFTQRYWWYLLAVGFVALGFADFPLMAYHFKQIDLAPDQWLPTFYALAMAVDALAALYFGRLFDKHGLVVLFAAFGVGVLFAPLVFLGGVTFALVGLGLWGIGMGAQESVMRAAIAEMVPKDQRATAYGLFHTGFGVFWFAGSALMGLLYDLSPSYVVVFSVLAQLAAIPIFWQSLRR